MELLSSEDRSLALDILYDIQSAIEKLQERTKRVYNVDDFLGSSEPLIQHGFFACVYRFSTTAKKLSTESANEEKSV